MAEFTKLGKQLRVLHSFHLFVVSLCGRRVTKGLVSRFLSWSADSRWFRHGQQVVIILVIDRRNLAPHRGGAVIDTQTYISNTE